MPLLSLFVDLQNKQLVRGFSNAIQTSLPACFQGDTLTLFLRFMNPTGNSSVPYVDADESSAAIEAAIGIVGGVPTGGTFTLTDPDAPQTTAPIAYNVDGPALQTAIRAGLTTNWSLATVTGVTGGPWTVTNGANATRSALVLVGTALTPAAQGDVIIQQAGSGSTPAIQYALLQLSPIAYQDTWTPYAAPTITVANVQTGGVSGSNSIQSVTLNNQPYNGTFTLSFGGQTTSPISFGAAPAAVQVALQALSSIGSGNCAVGGSIGAYQVTFIGTLGGLPQAAITASAAGLIGPLAMVGTLSLATVGIEEAIGETSSIARTFEIKLTPSGGNPQTVMQVPITIQNDLIPNAPAIPTPTAVYLTETVGDGRYTQQANNGSDFASLVTTLGNLWKSLTTTAGALLYMGAASTLTVLAPNSTGTQKFLAMTSSVPSWQMIVLPPPQALIKTGAYTAVALDDIEVDTSAGVVTITLPAAATVGDRIYLADAKGTFGTNALTIARNGLLINGSASNYTASVIGSKLKATYISSGYGWSIK